MKKQILNAYCCYVDLDIKQLSDESSEKMSVEEARELYSELIDIRNRLEEILV
jgi:hypothetical protein